MFECEYLGHVVGKGTVRLESSKIEAIKRMPVPRTKKEVWQFLGLAGYYRQFIRDFATIATPLTELTRKSAPQEEKWSLQAQEAFDTLKTKIASSPVLMCPDMYVYAADGRVRLLHRGCTQPNRRGWRRTPSGIFLAKSYYRENQGTQQLKKSASQSAWVPRRSEYI